MDNEKSKQLNDTAVRACADVLVETMKEAGFKEFLLLGARRDGESELFDVFARSDASTGAIANMLIFLFRNMNDESVGSLMQILLAQPEMMAKMAVHQAQVMTQRAEQLKAKAAASPESAQPSPEVPDKNKPWLN